LTAAWSPEKASNPSPSEAIGALYGVSYTLKFIKLRKTDPIDYPVMALEGLWWTGSGDLDFDGGCVAVTLMMLCPITSAWRWAGPWTAEKEAQSGSVRRALRLSRGLLCRSARRPHG
jgi:hypothetical protein